MVEFTNMELTENILVPIWKIIQILYKGMTFLVLWLSPLFPLLI